MNPFNAAASTRLTSKVLALCWGFTQLGAFQSLSKQCDDFVVKFPTDIIQAMCQRFESRSLNHLKCYQRSEVGEPEDDVPATQEPGARPEPGNEKSGNLAKNDPNLFHPKHLTSILPAATRHLPVASCFDFVLRSADFSSCKPKLKALIWQNELAMSLPCTRHNVKWSGTLLNVLFQLDLGCRFVICGTLPWQLATC